MLWMAAVQRVMPNTNIKLSRRRSSAPEQDRRAGVINNARQQHSGN